MNGLCAVALIVVTVKCAYMCLPKITYSSYNLLVCTVQWFLKMKSFLKYIFMPFLFRECVAQDSTPIEPYTSPSVDGVLFLADFQSSESSMTPSEVAKYNGQKYTIGEKSSVAVGIDGDKALYFDKPSHFGLTSIIDSVAPNGGDLVFQYEVRFTETVTCGGAYLKFLDAKRFSDPKSLNNESPYIVMFGPDKCGSDTNKVHFIVRHENPVSHEWTEHHFNSPPKIKSDTFSHLYTLVIHSDNTFEIKIDDVVEEPALAHDRPLRRHVHQDAVLDVDGRRGGAEWGGR